MARGQGMRGWGVLERCEEGVVLNKKGEEGGKGRVMRGWCYIQ